MQEHEKPSYMREINQYVPAIAATRAFLPPVPAQVQRPDFFLLGPSHMLCFFMQANGFPYAPVYPGEEPN